MPYSLREVVGLAYRIVVMTHNVWGSNRWSTRAEAFRHLYMIRRPDILCIQENDPEPAGVLAEVLPQHVCVQDAFEGWSTEGSIWWDSTRFAEIEHGAADVGLDGQRRLFWVQLETLGSQHRLLVATAHLPWGGLPEERRTRNNPRVEQAARIVAFLDAVDSPNMPCLFMGDLNEAYHPVRTLREGGFLDAFGALGAIPRPTSPIVPTATPSPGWGPGFDPPATVDWQFHRGPVVPELTEVVEGYHEGTAASDHAALLTCYRFTDDVV